MQVFLERYETWPFMRRGKKETFAFCEICACNLYIGSGGRYDINFHVENTEKHKKNVKLKESRDAKSKITRFFSVPVRVSIQIDQVRQACPRCDAGRNMMVDVAVDLKMPLNSLETLDKAVKSMFPDNESAQKFQCSRTEGTAMVKEAAAQAILGLGERMMYRPICKNT